MVGKHSPQSGKHGKGAPGTDAQKQREAEAKQREAEAKRVKEMKDLENKLRKQGKIK